MDLNNFHKIVIAALVLTGCAEDVADMVNSTPTIILMSNSLVKSFPSMQSDSHSTRCQIASGVYGVRTILSPQI